MNIFRRARSKGKTLSYLSFVFVAIVAMMVAQQSRAAGFWKGTGLNSGDSGNWTNNKPLLGADNFYIRDSRMTEGGAYRRAMALTDDAKQAKHVFFQAGTESDPFVVTGNNHELTFDILYVGGSVNTDGETYVGSAVLDGGSYKPNYFAVGGYNNALFTGYLKLTNGAKIATQSGSYNHLYNGKIVSDNCDVTLASRLYVGSAIGGHAEYYHIGSNLVVGAYISIGNFTSSNGKGYAYMEVDGGLVTNKTQIIIIGDNGESGDQAILNVKSGIVAANQNLYIGNRASGTILMNGGELDVSRGSIIMCYENGCGSGEDCSLVLSNGVVRTKTISYRSGTANAAILFDGGTLQAASGVAADLIPANNNLTVNVGQGGATIDANGQNVTISEPLNAVAGTSGGLAVTGGGTVTLPAADYLTGAVSIGDNTTLHYFDQDGTANAYELAGLTLGAGSKVYLNQGDSFGNTPMTISATSENKAEIEIEFSSSPAGMSYPLFPAAAGDEAKLIVTPKFGSLTIPHEVAVENGMLTLVITADDYTWNGSQTNWGDIDAWTKGGAAAMWADGNNAIFGTANATATLATDASAAEVRFTADATVSGNSTLSTPKVCVSDDVVATISAPMAGAFEKIGTGTLTLGANRSDQTTLSAGTLVMSNGATVDPAKLTLGTASAAPVTFDYGGLMLSGKWTDYLTPGMDITLTNGTFSTTQNPSWLATTSPKQLTIAANAVMTTSDRSTWNVSDIAGVDVTNIVNIVGGSLKFMSGNNNWLMQDSRSGTLKFNVSDGGLLEFAGQVNVLPCRDNTTANDTPCVLMSFNDSTFRLDNGKSLYLGCDYEDKKMNPLKPILELAMTNSTLDVGTGSIYLGHNVRQSNTGGHHTADFVNTVVTAKQFSVYADRPLNAARFDGARRVASANSDSFMSAQEGATGIIVGAVGLTLDVRDHTVGVDANLGGEGTVTKVGSGKLTIAQSQTTSGAFVCEAGETFLNAGMTMNRPVTVRSEATFTAGATNQSTVANLTLEAGSTLNIEGYTGGVVPLSVATLTLPDGDTASLLLHGGAFAVGIYKILENAGIAAEAVQDRLVPSTGGEAYSYSVSGDALVLTVGTPVHGLWIAPAGGNFSEPGNWSDGQVPVAGDVLDFSAVASSITINFGDLSETVFAGVNLGTAKRQITINGTLHIASMTVTAKDANFSVASGSKLIVDGDVTLNSANGAVLYIVYDNYGEVEVGGKVVISGNTKGYPCYRCSADATIAAKGIECNNSSGDHMKLNADKNDAPTVKWIVGEDGFGGTGSKSYWIDRGDGSSKHGTGAELKAMESFSIDRTIGARQILTFDTGDGKTITVNGEIYHYAEAGTVNTLTVKGSGTVAICNTVARPVGESAFKGAVDVTNTATLAINEGKLVTTGVITVNSNATLAVAESGTVALGGGLALRDGACLGFNFTARNEQPVLNLTDKTVTFDEGTTTNIVVKVSTTNGARPASGTYVVTSGGQFADATLSLPADAPKWVTGVSVNGGGNIVLGVKPLGTMFFVR